MAGGPARDDRGPDELVEAFFDRHRVGGAVAGVVRGAELTWTHAHGYTELTSGPRVQVTTPFRIASITKTFTATAVMQLREEGRVALDDVVIQHLPELQAAGDPIGAVTIKHLLTHRAGLPRESPAFDWAERRFPSVEETLDRAARLRFLGAPGTQHRYSNLGYQLLGEIVARAGELAYEEWIQRRVLEPLGMGDTAFVARGEPAAQGYEARVFSDWLPPADERRKPTEADGGLWSTVADLATWARFQLEGDDRVLSRGGLGALHAPSDDGPDPVPAIGWYRRGTGVDLRIGHSGGTFGFSSRLVFAPAHELAAIVLAAGSALVATLADPPSRQGDRRRHPFGLFCVGAPSSRARPRRLRGAARALRLGGPVAPGSSGVAR